MDIRSRYSAFQANQAATARPEPKRCSTFESIEARLSPSTLNLVYLL